MSEALRCAAGDYFQAGGRFKPRIDAEQGATGPQRKTSTGRSLFEVLLQFDHDTSTRNGCSRSVSRPAVSRHRKGSIPG
ncbi:hypothetical protein BN2476_110116 [Paraburkholderia piptadeniae]|uniref:Uncharacterized protein n=1 Tax=Paraburkholderia piptadeniae TaxID=1701573 RepID=A0A1N7RPT8_9BURK|nr:hypothetical protein BN2476_110116 [Paraburkholderia piptadeniae]